MFYPQFSAQQTATACKPKRSHAAGRHRVTTLCLAASMLLVAAQPAQAAIFADNEARTAILDLRQRYQLLEEDNARTQSTLQALQAQLDTIKSELEKSRRREEQLSRDVAELQRNQKNAMQNQGELLSATSDAAAAAGAVPEADAAQEQALFNHALNRFRNADYAGSQAALRNYLQRYPQGSQRIAAQYWLGNAEYALRNYSDAVTHFRQVVTQSPKHERAPEALLSIASSQVEMKDTAGARKTLEQLITSYPRSEAAQAAQDRLSRLR